MSYTGPGDLTTTGYFTWGGLRAFSAACAAATVKCINVVDGSGLNATDILVLSNGAIDVASLTTWIGAHGTAHVATIYDQSGTVASYTNNFTQGTVANMATVNMSPTGLGSGQIALNFTTSTFYDTANQFAAQPLVMSSFHNDTGSAGLALILSGANGNLQVAVDGGSGSAGYIFAGNVVTFSISKNTWYSLQCYVGATSTGFLELNGTTILSGQDFGAFASTGQPIQINGYSSGANSPMTGLWTQAGFTTGVTWATSDAAALNTNDGYWLATIPGGGGGGGGGGTGDIAPRAGSFVATTLW
jgi:hypothetical protein